VIGYVLARRYAKAIIELAQKAGLVSEIGDELNRIGELFAESHELIHLFADPTVGPELKEKILEDLLGKGGIQDLTRQFVHVLLSKNRLLGIGEIAVAYRDLSDQLNNRVRARIISAARLKDDEVDRIKKALFKISGQEVILELEVDENILGGIVAHLGSQVYDGSLRNQLQQIKENLSKGR
jgi:F-type H+-transporting ATPase subunit delta